MHLHLTVLQDNVREGENPTQAVLWNPQRTEFRWNSDFTAFYPIPLRWWDDASYIRYQAGDCGEDDHDDTYVSPTDLPGNPYPSPLDNDDNIPF